MLAEQLAGQCPSLCTRPLTESSLSQCPVHKLLLSVQTTELFGASYEREIPADHDQIVQTHGQAIPSCKHLTYFEGIVRRDQSLRVSNAGMLNVESRVGTHDPASLLTQSSTLLRQNRRDRSAQKRP